MTTTESRAIEAEIKKDYHGGQIGYYFNRGFAESFPHYEISYMEPTWDFVIEDTEYVVVPSNGLPFHLTNFKQCRYTFYTQVGMNTIYKVLC